LTFINSPLKRDLYDSRYIKASTILKIQHIHLAHGGHTILEIALHGKLLRWENRVPPDVLMNLQDVWDIKAAMSIRTRVWGKAAAKK